MSKKDDDEQDKDCFRDRWIGTVAVVLSISSLFPMLYHVVVNKSTHSLTYLWLVMVLITNCFWFSYGIRNNITPNSIAAGVGIGIFIIIIIVKSIYESTGKAHHLIRKAG